jgi:hypothetical protein
LTIAAIQTRYAGCHFRSRLEARWAVFFDDMGIPWQYEPQGFNIDGRNYLPDFLLTECQTWIEVKGDEHALDKPFLRTASMVLPQGPFAREPGPRLMVLGDIPRPVMMGDYGWVALGDGNQYRAGFGSYHGRKRPYWFDDEAEHRNWLSPTIDDNEVRFAQDSYLAARMSRFEHGQVGA